MNRPLLLNRLLSTDNEQTVCTEETTDNEQTIGTEETPYNEQTTEY